MWIKTKERSYEIYEINIVIKEENSELWAKRNDGSTIRLFKGDEQTAVDHKEAIEYSIKNGLTIYEM